MFFTLIAQQAPTSNTDHQHPFHQAHCQAICHSQTCHAANSDSCLWKRFHLCHSTEWTYSV